MPTNNIRVVVQGANPQTNTYAVNIPNGGSGSFNFTLTGNNVGTDTVQAFLDVKDLSTNQGQVVWQSAPNPISVATTLPVYYQAQSNGNTQIPSGLGSSGFQSSINASGLMFNAHPQSIFPGDPHSSGNQANPMVNNMVTSSGGYGGDQAIPQDNGGPILLAMVGTFIVQQTGQITFTSYANQGYVLGCPGASFISGANTFNGVTNTPMKNYPALAGRNGNWPGGNTAVDSFTLNFPAPGVYPFEIVFASGAGSERSFSLLANGSVIPICQLATVPTPPAPGSGSFTLVPNNAGVNIQGGSQTFTINFSGITFSSLPYVPVLEGTQGYLYVSNQSGNGYSFSTLPAWNPINYSTAISPIFSLSGNNGEWQGRCSITTNGSTDYMLAFNGNDVDASCESTTVTVTAKDIAWYNSNNQSFDTYSLSAQGGGASASVPIYWLIMPKVASVGPSRVSAGTFTLGVSLQKPIPPVQANILVQFSASGGVNIVDYTANFNSNGWITGWTVTAYGVGSGFSQSFNTTISCTATGAITYLSGNSFVTNTVTYFSGPIGTVTVETSDVGPVTVAASSTGSTGSSSGSSGSSSVSSSSAGSGSASRVTGYPVGQRPLPKGIIEYNG